MKIFNKICVSIVLSLLVQSYAAGFTAEQAEVITALARGPLAMLSHQYHNDYSGKAKLAHIATDLTRLANTVLSIVNHDDDRDYVSYFWAFIEIGNLIQDLKIKNVPQKDLNIDLGVDVDSNENISLEVEQNTENNFALDQKTSSLNRIIDASQKYLLPFVESTTALLVATNTEQNPEARLDRRCMRAVCSLSRALSVFSNNRKSIPAVALLLGAVTEMILVIQEKRELGEELDVANVYENAFDPVALENVANNLRQQNRPTQNDPHIRAIQRRINQLRDQPQPVPGQIMRFNPMDIDRAQQLENFANLLIQNNRYQENDPFIRNMRDQINELRRMR